jgi:hypothetical protein
MTFLNFSSVSNPVSCDLCQRFTELLFAAVSLPKDGLYLYYLSFFQLLICCIAVHVHRRLSWSSLHFLEQFLDLSNILGLVLRINTLNVSL